MKLFQRIFFAAVIAGLVAGLGMSALQQWRVAPLLLEAETYETAEAPATPDHDAAAAPATVADHDAVAGGHDAAAWAPQDGAERIGYTILANLLGSIGFALVLAAVSVVIGMPITVTSGVLWGLAGFVTFQLAPALGLSPGLPGMPVIPTAPRQLWWLAAVACTGVGLLLMARFRNWTAIVAGAALLLVPHIIGAPAPSPDPSAVPPALALKFAYASLATSAAFWLTVGPLFGWLNDRLAKSSAFALKGAHA